MALRTNRETLFRLTISWAWYLLGATLFFATYPAVSQDIFEQEQFDGPPAVTCEAWTVIDNETGQTIAGHNPNEVLRPASTTKMMTGLLVLELAEDSPEVLEETILFSPRADKTGGTTTGIAAGEKVKVDDLLYGLLLPSGNDASVALAEHFGDRMKIDSTSKGYDRFIAAMNQKAKQLGLDDTHYENPHGLDKDGHVTTAADLAVVAHTAMQISEFRKIVKTAQYQTTVDKPDGSQRVIQWQNTNQLLPFGYLGVKTGYTYQAKSCLVSCSQHNGRELIMVVLKSSSKDARFTDSRNLWRWIWTEAVKEKESTTATAN